MSEIQARKSLSRVVFLVIFSALGAECNLTETVSVTIVAGLILIIAPIYEKY